MNVSRNTTLGAAIYKDIDNNDYLNELYDSILYSYSQKLFRLSGYQNDQSINVTDALRFADLLSKSMDEVNSDKHKIWAQEIVALLHYIYPNDETIKYYMGSVLSNTGNYLGLQHSAPGYHSYSLLDRIYTDFNIDYLTVPADPGIQFFHSQKDVYDHFSDPYFSYSGPTSMGKSFIMRMYIKQRIIEGFSQNFAILVPTKALINEVTSKVINDLTVLLSEHNYRLVTSAGALVLKQEHNFIFVLTPERLLYLLISNPEIRIDYLFVDEAHKISANDSRSTFYYKVVDMLAQQEPKPHIIFSSPNIPNPEVYLSLIPGVTNIEAEKLASSFAPVSQVKYLIDFQEKEIQHYNSYSEKLTQVATIKDDASFCTILAWIADDSQNIIYCSSTASAVDFAREYAKDMPVKTDKELIALSNDIKSEVHAEYYLAELITKGVAYHIGYLPATIRMRIEELFKLGLIKTMFCTSTLVEGVNLPADNLFITSYKNGSSQMSPVDFKNLIGRVGRIEYNLYGNVFLVCLPDTKIKKEKYVELLQKDVPEQKLSIVTGLTKPQKETIVQCLCDGNIEILKHPDNQTAESYALMRKFAIILLRDIIKGRNSTVKMEFEPFLKDGDEDRIRSAFGKGKNTPDDDINISVDQADNLTSAIAHGLHYPLPNENGNFDYKTLLHFLEQLCKIFKWEIYEPKTIGYLSQSGVHSMLSWYAVILSQWMQGSGLSFIVGQAIEYKRSKPLSNIRVNGKLIPYVDIREHRNVVIAETLSVIENVILFSFSNYFLRFSTEYKRFHHLEAMPNDWYEYVEYGTTNPLTITLQRSGFSRETSTYIKTHRDEFVVMQHGEVKLRRSLLECGSISVRKEAADIIYNIPELFTKQ